MKGFLSGILLLVAPICLRCQPVLPSWLLTYPGATVTRQNLAAMSAASFTTADPPETVVDRYRQLFAENGLPFSPTSNRLATTVRAAADCGELSISITSRGSGSAVRLNCTVKVQPRVVKSTGNYEQDVANMKEAHRQAAAEMGMGRARPAAPAPPLEWPAWLAEVEGGLPAIQKGTDQAGNLMLRAEYVSGSPMSQIFSFYKDLLTANGYQVNRGYVTTGRTQSGIKQNALGAVEGSIYPDGFPGPRSEIKIGFSRMNLNDPIRVNIRFTTFAYAGSPGLVH
jgi:hypothetical protein